MEAVYSLELGGIERLVSGLAPHFAEVHGVPSAVVCLGTRSGPLLPDLEKRGIPVFHAPRMEGGPQAWMDRLEQVLREWKTEVFHTHYSFGLLWQVKAARRAGVSRVVITEQNAYRFGLAARLRNLVYDRLYWRHIHAYTCVSEAVRRHLARSRMRPERAFEVVHNSVDVDLFRPDGLRRESARKAWGVAPETVVIGSVGRLTRQKGFPYLIEAAAQVCAAHPDVQFRIFGEGEERPRLEEHVRRLGLRGRVILEGARPNLHELLPGLDLYVMPSLWEGMSLAIAEAMATRLPIIGTAVPGTTDLLAEGAGLLVPPADPKALAEAIAGLHDDAPARQRLAETAYARAHQLFSLRRCAESYLDIFSRPSPVGAK